MKKYILLTIFSVILISCSAEQVTPPVQIVEVTTYDDLLDHISKYYNLQDFHENIKKKQNELALQTDYGKFVQRFHDEAVSNIHEEDIVILNIPPPDGITAAIFDINSNKIYLFDTSASRFLTLIALHDKKFAFTDALLKSHEMMHYFQLKDTNIGKALEAFQQNVRNKQGISLEANEFPFILPIENEMQGLKAIYFPVGVVGEPFTLDNLDQTVLIPFENNVGLKEHFPFVDEAGLEVDGFILDPRFFTSDEIQKLVLNQFDYSKLNDLIGDSIAVYNSDLNEMYKSFVEVEYKENEPVIESVGFIFGGINSMSNNLDKTTKSYQKYLLDFYGENQPLWKDNPDPSIISSRVSKGVIYSYSIISKFITQDILTSDDGNKIFDAVNQHNIIINHDSGRWENDDYPRIKIKMEDLGIPIISDLNAEVPIFNMKVNYYNYVKDGLKTYILEEYNVDIEDIVWKDEFAEEGSSPVFYGHENNLIDKNIAFDFTDSASVDLTSQNS